MVATYTEVMMVLCGMKVSTDFVTLFKTFQIDFFKIRLTYWLGRVSSLLQSQL